ncbi:ATPase WRNIP1 isoform X2 [Boleophthalmus pectinirostris]|uniref:ATPase WRNIP1 isoform X2 n=1 Tax=Boleophthalmus pectinirostris TaxID=150288 RepID=UPI000A1C5DF6|nr:ATPase WRNIP1 isoform X2 [Boleophthalmus pectinirostris]
MAEEASRAADSASDSVQCPVCLKIFKQSTINRHLDVCLLGGTADSSPMTVDESVPPAVKKMRTAETVLQTSAPPSSTAGSTSSSPMFAMFQPNKNKSPAPNERQGKLFSKQNSGNIINKGIKRGLEEESEQESTSKMSETGASSNGEVSKDLARRILFTLDKPLAEILRPKSLEEYFGQNKVVGEHTLLRSLLETQEIPSLILWGPPGCGKTTLAHIIACSSKKKGTSRFITLSATSASTNEVREVIKQAHNELRLCKRRTILFIDEIHRFNKSQQDTFLPHVENGTITLIGATTENPSFQVNAALLSRCRVLVLEKLSVEAMGSILQRAVESLDIRVVGAASDRLKPAEESDGQQPLIYIEQDALDTIAYLCDGDARTGLNSLQLAVQAQVSLAQNKALQGGAGVEIVVKEAHVKEGLQRSHILYDKAGEEHYNCISALHKSMRGSHENASLYWLGRMLEGGEDPLYVARRLIRFASEDVGMADPLALPQAVSAFQACHFIGMPECEVILAQCVVYLAQAPKSVDVYKAYNNVKASLRNHKGPLPPVPLHLRNAPTKLMKQLGYSKGYKYNPNFTGPVEQEYLPQELKDIDFFTWTPS